MATYTRVKHLVESSFAALRSGLCNLCSEAKSKRVTLKLKYNIKKHAKEKRRKLAKMARDNPNLVRRMYSNSIVTAPVDPARSELAVLL